MGEVGEWQVGPRWVGDRITSGFGEACESNSLVDAATFDRRKYYPVARREYIQFATRTSLSITTPFMSMTSIDEITQPLEFYHDVSCVISGAGGRNPSRKQHDMGECWW